MDTPLSHIYKTLYKSAVLLLSAVAVAHADANEFSQVTYRLTQPLNASSPPGQAGDELGDLSACAVITTGQSGRDIEVNVTMPDSGQTISIHAPLKRLRDGGMVFTFDDDGWGNFGRGSLKVSGNNARLNLVNTGSKPDAAPNVLRNYGTFSLTRGPCSVPH